jgi:hypothetical protein
MNAAQIKNEIRKLSRADKIEIYGWIDEEAAADLLFRIGVLRNRTAVRSDDPERRVDFGLDQLTGCDGTKRRDSWHALSFTSRTPFSDAESGGVVPLAASIASSRLENGPKMSIPSAVATYHCGRCSTAA